MDAYVTIQLDKITGQDISGVVCDRQDLCADPGKDFRSYLITLGNYDPCREEHRSGGAYFVDESSYYFGGNADISNLDIYGSKLAVQGCVQVKEVKRKRAYHQNMLQVRLLPLTAYPRQRFIDKTSCCIKMRFAVQAIEEASILNEISKSRRTIITFN